MVVSKKSIELFFIPSENGFIFTIQVLVSLHQDADLILPLVLHSAVNFIVGCEEFKKVRNFAALLLNVSRKK